MKQAILSAIKKAVSILEAYATYSGIYNVDAMKAILSDSVSLGILEKFLLSKGQPHTGNFLNYFLFKEVAMSPMLGFKRTYIEGLLTKDLIPIFSDIDNTPAQSADFQVTAEGTPKVTALDDVVIYTSKEGRSLYPVMHFIAARVSSDFGSTTSQTDVNLGADYLYSHQKDAHAILDNPTGQEGANLHELMSGASKAGGFNLLKGLDKLQN